MRLSTPPVPERLARFLHDHPLRSLAQILEHPFSDPHRQDPIWTLWQAGLPPGDCAQLPFPEIFVRVFLYVRNLNKELFLATEDTPDNCTQKSWEAPDYHPEKSLFGGGRMTVLRGGVLEKAAVNMSLVHGPRYPALEGQHAGKPFVAGGVSLIAHPRNPYAPIVHLNVRFLQAGVGAEQAQWVGGGADLTPMMPFPEDTTLFHKSMQQACDNNPPWGEYEKYRAWADEYFYIPHRKEIRGVGGIFFDFLPIVSADAQGGAAAFLLDVGQQMCLSYAEILSRRVASAYSEELADRHLFWRGRYAEFNLAYDRGTRFGLMTGGNAEAILCSLPPRVKW